MKRITSLLLAVLLVFSLSACGLPEVSDGADGEKAEWETFIEEYNDFVDEYVSSLNSTRKTRRICPYLKTIPRL